MMLKEYYNSFYIQVILFFVEEIYKTFGVFIYTVDFWDKKIVNMYGEKEKVFMSESHQGSYSR